MNFRLTRLAQALGTTFVITLAACGGGGGGNVDTAASVAPAAPTGTSNPPATGSDSGSTIGSVDTPTPTPTPAAATVTLAGAVMVDQAIRNAVVCLDVNANGTCDADEPASAPTGATGEYSLTIDSARFPAADLARLSLIAPMVPGAVGDATTTIDAADTSTGNAASRYVLRQVPGKAGQINPLTTLVAKGIAQGMSEAEARANIASQLKIGDAKIDSYQDDAATSNAQVRDNARTVALVAGSALQDGITLSVGDPLAATTAEAGDLANLSYTDSGNYFVRYFARTDKPAGTPGASALDVRAGRTNGSLSSFTSGYGFAYLTPAGWTRCDGPWESNVGTPSRSVYCGVSQSVGYTRPISIAGRSMADVVRELQVDPGNVINVGAPIDNLLAVLGSAVFPAGSALNERHTLTLASGIQIVNLATDGRPPTESQLLEDLIATHPAAAANIILPGASGSLTLGTGSSASKNLRVAFNGAISDSSGTVQFYECDIAQGAAANCAATTTGTYSIETVYGVRVMRFAGYAPTTATNTRLYVEVRNAPSVAAGNTVYMARENKADFASNGSMQKRLNATASAAIQAALGL